MFSASSLLKDALHLFYPHLCISCGDDVLAFDQLICKDCFQNLPRTHFYQLKENSIDKIFYGRLNIKAAHSEFYFTKGHLLQHLVHQLKYKNNKDIGIYLGKLMGQSLAVSERFKNIDCIIPIPMFKQKEIKRGYNQAAIVAMGVAEAMQIPLLTHEVKRILPTSTQTKKHRAERWENVKDTFVVDNKNQLSGKSILLVDDVITTGATLEACGEILLQIPGVIVSIATLAHAVS